MKNKISTSSKNTTFMFQSGQNHTFS